MNTRFYVGEYIICVNRQKFHNQPDIEPGKTYVVKGVDFGLSSGPWGAVTTYEIERNGQSYRVMNAHMNFELLQDKRPAWVIEWRLKEEEGSIELVGLGPNSIDAVERSAQIINHDAELSKRIDTSKDSKGQHPALLSVYLW